MRISDWSSDVCSSDLTTPPYEPPPPSTTQTLTATENLAVNDLVNIYNSSGAKVRKANATDGTKPAHGYVKEAVVSGNPAIVFFDGENAGLSGLTAGTYFLSTTGGQMSTSPPRDRKSTRLNSSH